MIADAAHALGAEGARAWSTPWRTLRYFELTRVVVAAVLTLYVPILRNSDAIATGFDALWFGALALGYLVVALVWMAVPRFEWAGAREMATWQVALDVVAVGLLLHLSGGVRSGLAILFFLPNAGAAVLARGRLAFFYAAVATLIILGETVWREVRLGEGLFLQAGLIGAGLLATVMIVQRLAARLVAQERLAWQRGEDLRKQFAVTQAIIRELPDGVVVFSAAGALRAINRSAREMLGEARDGHCAADDLPGLALVQRVVAEGSLGFGSGLQPAMGAVELTVPDPGDEMGRAERRLRARRLELPQIDGDAVVVLEDLGRLEERAQQLKLAAMGRLSASIAHEIRNPLAAIRHANGLLAEQLVEGGLQRLATIVEDNCQRIDRIVEDVLSIARRGGAAPELLAPAPFIGEVLAEYFAQTGGDPLRVSWRASVDRPIRFDAGHLRQVMLNLVANALRYASAAPGAVQIEWLWDVRWGLSLVISDDGPGVPEPLRAHLFEPFFTTEVRGTGLGLHLAREFCAANGAVLRYRPPSVQPPVRSAFVIEPPALHHESA